MIASFYWIARLQEHSSKQETMAGQETWLPPLTSDKSQMRAVIRFLHAEGNPSTEILKKLTSYLKCYDEKTRLTSNENFNRINTGLSNAFIKHGFCEFGSANSLHKIKTWPHCQRHKSYFHTILTKIWKKNYIIQFYWVTVRSTPTSNHISRLWLWTVFKRSNHTSFATLYLYVQQNPLI